MFTFYYNRLFISMYIIYIIYVHKYIKDSKYSNVN